MIVQHNIMAINSHNRLATNNTNVSKNLEKLSSGFKINRAGDDAAGLAISEKMRAQITGLSRAQQNAQDGISLVQTAEGNMTEVHSMLNRMIDLATQSANGTYEGTSDRAKIQEEVIALRAEIDRIAENADFNGIKLFDGSKSGATTLKAVGANIGAAKGITDIDVSGLKTGAEVVGTDLSIAYDAASKTFTASLTTGTGAAAVTKTQSIVAATPTLGKTTALNFGDIGLSFKINDGFDDTADIDTDNAITTDFDSRNGGISLQIGDTALQKVDFRMAKMDSTSLVINDLDFTTAPGANAAITTIKEAINKVSTERGKLGAIQNRLEHTISNLSTTTENMTAAESRIRDTDMAKEMMQFTKNNVLAQAAQAMLAQANQQPQQILQLLR